MYFYLEPFQCSSRLQVIPIIFILIVILYYRNMTIFFTLGFLVSCHEFKVLLIGAYKKCNYIITNRAHVYYT
jgi:hypothetical protein